MTGANAIENAKVGIATAAEKIMVPELLSAENLTNPACDENRCVSPGLYERVSRCLCRTRVLVLLLA